jgi:hypothetical protein
MVLYRDWLALAFLEKVSDPDGRNGPSGASHHRGQTPFPQHQSGQVILRPLKNDLRWFKLQTLRTLTGHKVKRYFSSEGINFNDALFMQYRFPVGWGPSSKT